MQLGNNNESFGRSRRKTAAISSGRSPLNTSAAREAAAGFSVVASREKNWTGRRWSAVAVFGITLVVLFLFLWQGPFSALREAPAQSNVTEIPTEAGDVEVGKTLEIDLSTFTDPDGYTPSNFSYQWHADGVAISGATSNTYRIKFNDTNKLIHVVVSYTDSASNSVTLVSNTLGPARFVLSDTAAVGETLTIPDGRIGDSAVTYAWYFNGTLINGATTTGYRIKFRETGMRFHVTVTLTDSNETFTSLPTGPAVFNLNGIVEQDQTLRLANGYGGRLKYAWYSGRDVRDYRTGNSYWITSSDVGKQIFVEITYVGATGAGAVVRSAAVGPVPPSDKVNHRPVAGAGGFVNFSGYVAVGETLNAASAFSDLNVYDSDDLNQFNHSKVNHFWYSGGQLVHRKLGISSVLGSSYFIKASDIGKKIHVVIEYTDGDGFDERVVSRILGPVPFKANNPATGALDIEPWPGTMNPFEIHQLLLVNHNGIEDLDGSSSEHFNYQWLRNGGPIAGATDWSYRVQGDDGGTDLSVRVSFVDSLGFDEQRTTPEILIPYGPEIVAPEGAYLGKTLSVDLSRMSYPDMPADRRYEYRWNYVTLGEDGRISASRSISGVLEGGIFRNSEPTLTLTQEDVDAEEHINVKVRIIDDSNDLEWDVKWASYPTPLIILRPLVKSPVGVNATLPSGGGSFTIRWGLSNITGESPFGFMYRYRLSTSPDFTGAYAQVWEFAPGGAEVRKVEISGNFINGAEYFFEVTGLYSAFEGDETTTDSATAAYQHRTRNC